MAVAMIGRLMRGAALAVAGIAMLAAQPALAQSILRDAETESLLDDMSSDMIRAAGLSPANVRVVIVNDKSVECDEQITVARLMERLGFPEKGIAVAVDATVLPRSRWQTTLSDGARLEVVTAVQGG